MKLTLEPTATIDTIGRTISARIWEGHTDTGVPVKAWIAVVQPQTDDEALLAAFAQRLKEVPASRELTSFDIRLAI
jgi:hypothetical protein